MNADTHEDYEDLDLDDEELRPAKGDQTLTLQIPLVLPMDIRKLAALIDSTEATLKTAFGNKVQNLVVRNAPNENPCFQFDLHIPKQRTRNRKRTGRPPGRPRKNVEGEG